MPTENTVRPPCRLHVDSPGECPQAHVCGRCEKPLSEHQTTGVYCPDGTGGRFRPDDATLERFPEQYRKVVEVS